MSKIKKGRPPKLDKTLDKLKPIGIFRVKDAMRIGISRQSLSRYVAHRKILRIDTGFYLHSKSSISGEEREFALACAKFGPKSTIGGMTALFHYRLIEQIPRRIWIIVPYKYRSSRSLYRCLRTQTNPNVGIENHGIYRITNIERTLVEAFRYSSKIGLRVAFRATRTALKNKQTTMEKIYREAKKLHLEKFISRYWETLIPESQADG